MRPWTCLLSGPMSVASLAVLTHYWDVFWERSETREAWCLLTHALAQSDQTQSVSGQTRAPALPALQAPALLLLLASTRTAPGPGRSMILLQR